MTYAQLLSDVQRLANALKQLGVGRGDVVGIYLPMIPEVVVAMLACARIGAPHNVVFGGFAAGGGEGADGGLQREGADHRRRRAAQGQDGARSSPPSTTRWTPWRRWSTSSSCATRVSTSRCATAATCSMTSSCPRPTRSAPPEPMEAEHPLFILYSSGSTAKPKGIVHTSGGYLTGVAATHRLRVRPGRGP